MPEYIEPTAGSGLILEWFKDFMTDNGVSFEDAHMSRFGQPVADPRESLPVKTHLTAEHQAELLEFVREHEEWDKQEQEAAKSAEQSRKSLYERLKTEFGEDE
jgi:hypothetical protein